MLELKINDAQITAALAQAIAALGDLTPVMEEIGSILLDSTKQRFVTGEAPDGTPWVANSPVTLARKKGSRPLIGATGALAEGFQVEASSNSVQISTDKDQALMMQFGGTKAQFPHLWGDIPARPFLGDSEEDRQNILDTISDALEAALQP